MHGFLNPGQPLAAARAFYDSCKEALPATAYQSVKAGDPAADAALPWGPEQNGLRFALVLPAQVKRGESFALTWAVQNTGTKPVRLLFMNDGSPWLKWTGPDGKELSTSLNPSLNVSFHVPQMPHRVLLPPGQCLRHTVHSPLRVVEKSEKPSAFDLQAGPGTISITGTLHLPGTQSSDDDKQKVISPAKGEYEGILTSVAAVEVE